MRLLTRFSRRNNLRHSLKNISPHQKHTGFLCASDAGYSVLMWRWNYCGVAPMAIMSASKVSRFMARLRSLLR